MVSCTFCVAPDASVALGWEKWQVTAAGSDPQPSPMVSAKPLIEVRFTEIVVFCLVFSVTEVGDVVSEKLDGRLVTVTEIVADVDGACSASPLYAATMLYVPTARLGVRLAAPVASTVTVPRTVAPDLNCTVPVGVGPDVATTVANRTTCGGVD